MPPESCELGPEGQALACLTLREESDLVVIRRQVRELGRQVGLAANAVEALATAVTEVARNAVTYARGGEVRFSRVRRGASPGLDALLVTVRDAGPGIADIEAAMTDGFSTGGSLGFGLPGARRLVDVFEIRSAAGRGTTVSLEKWALPRR